MVSNGISCTHNVMGGDHKSNIAGVKKRYFFDEPAGLAVSPISRGLSQAKET